MASSAFLVELAGGKVSGFSGDEKFLFGKEIVATNGKIQNELLEVMRQQFLRIESNPALLFQSSTSPSVSL